MSEINDVREKSKFTKLTFSNYKKTDVLKQLIKSITIGNRESTCYWSAELLCGGQILELWEIIILYMSKNIHIGNPKLPIYINKSLDNFKNIVNSTYIDDDLSIRNNVQIRKLFAEIFIILLESKRKHSFAETVKITTFDFNISNIGEKLKAPHINYIKSIFKEGDTKEIYIALNELYYNISDIKDSVMACYWIEWILEFDVVMRRQKKKNLCERRSYVPVKQEFQMNIIWMIWDIFFHKGQSNMEKKILNSLLDIFCLRFSNGVPKKRKFILYFIVSLFTEPVDYNTALINNIDIIEKVKSNIDSIYKEIKKNEHSPKMDYLFINEKKTNKEKTIEKLNILNKFNF